MSRPAASACLGWLQRVSARQSAAGVALPWHSFARGRARAGPGGGQVRRGGADPAACRAPRSPSATRPPPRPPTGSPSSRGMPATISRRGHRRPRRCACSPTSGACCPGSAARSPARAPRATTSPVDRLVALSGAKHAATAQILDAEWQVRGAALRSVVLTDFEAETATLPASLRDVGTLERRLGTRPARHALARASIDGQAGGLAPGPRHRPKTLAAAPEVAVKPGTPRSRGGRSSLTTTPLEGFEGSLVVVGGDGFGPAAWTALATAHLVAGETHCLVGTRGLLGEGWDCPALNVLVDLTSAATATAVAQIRGRSLRRDPGDPAKIASNWTVACLAGGHPRGDADWRRAVRKHESVLALAVDGEIETGIGHCLPHGVADPAVLPDAALSLEGDCGIAAAGSGSACGPGGLAHRRALCRRGDADAAVAQDARPRGALGADASAAARGGATSRVPGRRPSWPWWVAVIVTPAFGAVISPVVAIGAFVVGLLVGAVAAGVTVQRRTVALAAAAAGSGRRSAAGAGRPRGRCR